MALPTCEEESLVADDLVEVYGRVEGYEAVEEGSAEERDHIAAHRDEHGRVGEHLRAGRAARDRHAVATDASQALVLALKRVVCTRVVWVCESGDGTTKMAAVCLLALQQSLIPRDLLASGSRVV